MAMSGSGYNKSKFRFSETFNNTDGKTSGSGFMGVIAGLTFVLGSLVLIAGWWFGKPNVLEMFDKILQIGLLSSVLLGVRKISGTINNNKNNVVNTSETEDKDAKTV